MYKLNFKNEGGFSLIELLVSIAILVVVSGLVFFNQSGFNNSVLIENLAYEISLTIRQAQSYGLQSREAGTGTDDFMAGYGVYFSLATPDQIILYADDGIENKVYDASSDTIIDTLKMTNGSQVVKLCTSQNCVTSINTLDISFIRPNPTAYINTSNSYGEVYIRSLKNEEKKVTINKIGQISIDSTP